MRVVCAALSGPGHAHPMLAVARALAELGHEVTFASSTEHVGDAARARAAFVPLPITPGSPLEALRPYEDSEHLARAFAPTVGAIKPDVMVVDLLTLGAAWAAEMCGVPHASLLIHGLHTPSSELPPFGWGHPPARGMLRARDAWMRRAHLRGLERARDELNEARERLGLERTARADPTLSPDLQLVATLPSLEIERDDWPEHAHVIGPCLWDAGGLVPPLGAGPNVLIAGTTARDDDGFAAGAREAIEACGAKALGGDGAFLNHDVVLRRCAAVVCNGGHGIVARALSNGVPLVVLPGHGDQRENGYRVERAGAGLRVMRPGKLADALRRVLTEPVFAEAARRIQAEASALDGPGRAADLVGELARRRVP